MAAPHKVIKWTSGVASTPAEDGGVETRAANKEEATVGQKRRYAGPERC